MSDISTQLVDRVREALDQNGQLNILGRSTKTFMGREALGDAISVAEHSGVVSYDPVELVMTARAGTSLVEIEQTLQQQGQTLSFEPPDFGGRASIGGTLACNLSGPSRPWSGSLRDMVLGVKMINGRAEQLSFGGQVMKNVAGYDVSRLQAGAMGTLGILTEISFKVMPSPATTVTMVQEMDAVQAIQTMNTMAGQTWPLSGACWLQNKLYLRLSGAARAVATAVKKCSGEQLDNNGFWLDLREQQLDFFSGESPLWRFSVGATAAHFETDSPWLLDWGGAQRWLRGSYDKEVLEAAAQQAGGQLMLVRGGDRAGEVFHTQGSVLKLIHQRMKASLDPDGIFNPGRLYSWL